MATNGTGVTRAQRSRPLLRNTLGAVLRRVRRAQGRTLADVARAARVSMPYLSEIERGRKEASSEVLAAVCDALRIELPDLLAEVGRELAGRRARRAPARPAGTARVLPLDAAEVIPLDAAEVAPLGAAEVIPLDAAGTRQVPRAVVRPLPHRPPASGRGDLMARLAA